MLQQQLPIKFFRQVREDAGRKIMVISRFQKNRRKLNIKQLLYR